MNKVILIGRIGRDPEIKYTTGQNQMAVARFSLAVERKYKAEGKERETDWFNCVAFGKTAENIGKYFFKGSKIALSGRLQNNNWGDNTGQKHYNIDIFVEDFDFVENKKTSDKTENASKMTNNESDFYTTSGTDEDGEDLPF